MVFDAIEDLVTNISASTETPTIWYTFRYNEIKLKC